MSILDELIAKTLELRKSRDELAGAFQLTQAQVTAFAKERGLKSGDFTPLEEDAVRAIQKSIKQVQDTLSRVPTDAKSLRELEMLESLLPKSVSIDELKSAMDDFMRGNTAPLNMKLMGPAMKYMLDSFGVSLDKALANQVVRERLTANG